MSDKKKIRFSLNGQTREFEVTARETLLELLRRSNLVGTKNGCTDGACGSCTVIMDGKSINSCITLAFQAHGRKVVSIEGIGTYEEPHPFQQAMVEDAGIQCGFCIPGIIMSVKAMLDEIPNPSREEIMENVDGNFCRCTGYEKIEDALHKTIAAGVKGAPQWKR